MRRFSVAAIVLAVLGAFLTTLGGTESGKPRQSASVVTEKPTKRSFAQRRSERAQAERAGAAAIAAGKVAELISPDRLTAATKAEPVSTVAKVQIKPDATAQASAQPQSQPAVVNADVEASEAAQAEPGTASPGSVDYLPPSMRGKAHAEAAGDNATAAKPKAKAKTQQAAGARVIYRTHQTSGYEREYERAYGYQRGPGRGYSQSWGW
jgi:hypothetical protein